MVVSGDAVIVAGGGGVLVQHALHEEGDARKVLGAALTAGGELAGVPDGVELRVAAAGESGGGAVVVRGRARAQAVVVEAGGEVADGVGGGGAVALVEGGGGGGGRGGGRHFVREGRREAVVHERGAGCGRREREVVEHRLGGRCS